MPSDPTRPKLDWHVRNVDSAIGSEDARRSWRAIQRELVAAEVRVVEAEQALRRLQAKLPMDRMPAGTVAEKREQANRFECRQIIAAALVVLGEGDRPQEQANLGGNEVASSGGRQAALGEISRRLIHEHGETLERLGEE